MQAVHGSSIIGQGATINITGAPTMQEAISGCKYLEGIEPVPTNQQLLSQIAYENLAKS